MTGEKKPKKKEEKKMSESSGKKRQRISVATGEGLLTEEDMSRLLDLPVDTVINLIDKKILPGRRIAPRGTFHRRRTLTSVRELIKFAEEKIGEPK